MLNQPVKDSPDLAKLMLQERAPMWCAMLMLLAKYDSYFAAEFNRCINDIRLKISRTPERDKERIVNMIFVNGGGTASDIAEWSKLPRDDVRVFLGILTAEKKVVAVSKKSKRGAGLTLYFLPEK